MPVLKKSHEELAEIARQIRKDVCVMTHVAKSGHAGGPLSAADAHLALVAQQRAV